MASIPQGMPRRIGSDPGSIRGKRCRNRPGGSRVRIRPGIGPAAIKPGNPGKNFATVKGGVVAQVGVDVGVLVAAGEPEDPLAEERERVVLRTRGVALVAEHPARLGDTVGPLVPIPDRQEAPARGDGSPLKSATRCLSW